MDYYQTLKKFIKKDKADRLVFELVSKNKRDRAFSKLTQFDSYMRKELIKFDFTKMTDEEVSDYLKKEIKVEKCFDVKNGTVRNLLDAVLDSINSYLFNVCVLDENRIIYIGEVEYGPSQKYLMEL